MKIEHNHLDEFAEIWLVDSEYHQPAGERPEPICMIAKGVKTGKIVRLSAPFPQKPPFGQRPNELFVAYFASAELSCYLALGWPFPPNVLDLYAEFRLLNCGREVAHGFGLLGALAHFGISSIGSVEKSSMQELATRGGPFTASEIAALISYCETDVTALSRLLVKMEASIDFPRCLIRGEYTKAIAKMEFRGIPVDAPFLQVLQREWTTIQAQFIRQIDADYGVYDGLTFKADRWGDFLLRNQISWPRLPSGGLALDDETFKDMARIHPIVAPIREARRSLSQLRLKDFAVGSDDRHRCMLSPFGGKTGRNQPSTSKFIFGGPAWLRNLIRPAADKALAYVDYAQQEFGIAAALSGDANMMGAYTSGDPYLRFAVMAGAVPAGATKESHSVGRELFKSCALGVQYGMQAESLALRISRSPAHGRELIDLHRRTFPRYWRWSDAVQDHAMLHGKLTAAFGWQVNVGLNPNPRSLRNFPLQANGAEMLRFACIFAHERGVEICAPVHDALLIEAPVEDIGAAVATCEQSMAEASALVLDGPTLRTDARIIRPGQRFADPRGRRMWDIICGLVAEYDQTAA